MRGWKLVLQDIHVPNLYKAEDMLFQEFPVQNVIYQLSCEQSANVGIDWSVLRETCRRGEMMESITVSRTETQKRDKRM